MELNATNWEDYEKQFIAFLDSEDAKKDRGVVYFWKTKKPMKRLSGESRVFYIGETSRSFSERYYPSSNWEIEHRYFDNHYRQYIEDYQAISIEILKVSDHKKAEFEALNIFKELCGELPPLNYRSGSKAHSDRELEAIRSKIVD